MVAIRKTRDLSKFTKKSFVNTFCAVKIAENLPKFAFGG